MHFIVVHVFPAGASHSGIWQAEQRQQNYSLVKKICCCHSSDSSELEGEP
jgi:hypothetical protein